MSNGSPAITPLGDGVFRVERGDGSRSLAYAVVEGSRTWVFAEGVTYVLEETRSGRSAGAHDATALSAPMPATVTQLHVAVGDTVRRGDVLVTLEAMKMELPIRAATDGIVRSIACRIGELVQPGVPLLEVDEPEP